MRLHKFLIVTIFLAGIMMMIFSWWDAFRWYQSYRNALPEGPLIPTISFRLNGGNTIAAFYSLIAFNNIGIFINGKSKLLKIIAGAAGFSAVILIFLSTSRGAILGLLVGAFILLAWYFKEKILFLYRIGRRQSRSTYLILGGILIIVIMAVGFVVWIFLTATTHPTHGYFAASRNEFWGPAIQAFISSLLFGTGPYTFYIWYKQNNSIPPHQLFLHAHNSYLDILANDGLIGIIILFFVIFWFIKLLIKNGVIVGSDANFYTALVSGIVAFSVHSLFDGLYLMVFAGFLIIIFLVLVFHRLSFCRINRVERLILVILCASVGIYSWVHHWQVEQITNAISAYQRNDLNSAQNLVLDVIEKNPNNTIANIYSGLLHSESLPNIRSIAIPDFERAITNDPYWGVSHANLSALLSYDHQYELALSEMIKAIEIAPKNYIFLLNLGVIQEKIRDYSSAERSYLTVLKEKPEWRNSFFWRENTFRKELSSRFRLDEPTQNLSYSDASNQPYAIFMINTAFMEIDHGNISRATTLLNLAKLAYFNNPNEALELNWLEAKLAFLKGDTLSIIHFSKEIFTKLTSPGIFGPGSAGRSIYYDGVYRYPVLHKDFVQQMTIISLPGEWEKRLFEMSNWCNANISKDICLEARNLLLIHAPDYDVLY